MESVQVEDKKPLVIPTGNVNLDDKDFCVNCLKGIHVPGEIRLKEKNPDTGENLKLKRTGCIAQGLFAHGLIKNPEKLCMCLKNSPEKHPLEIFVGIPLKASMVDQKEQEIRESGQLSLDAVEKPIIDVED